MGGLEKQLWSVALLQRDYPIDTTLAEIDYKTDFG